MTILLLIVLGFTTHQGLTRPGVSAKYRFSAEGIRLRRQWIRLVSPAFLHAGWGHFAANAITLFFFGRQLELEGPELFLGVFFLSVVGGSALCLWLHREEEYQAVGASGGALGVLFACVFLFPGMRLMMFPLPIPIPAWLYAFGFLLFTLQGLHRGSGGISHEGHLGGLITGVLLAWIQFPDRVQSQPLLLASVLGASAAGIWYFHVNPGRVPGFLRWRVREGVNDIRRKRSTEQALHVDALLDKVAREGIHSLTPRERKVLEEASKQRRGTR
ncbi:MAG: rhomboid family intramembrane serine protease [Kiritimatiellae bacterium]|nr:rhomboid family intramembrane serine protease [Kiritimatiellia bacterium]